MTPSPVTPHSVEVRTVTRKLALSEAPGPLARTETMAALGQAQEEAYRQSIAKGAVSADQIEGTWHTAGDNRVRDTHEAMDGQKAKFNQPFRSPSGALLLYPGDTSFGAGASEICNCRCWRELKINFSAGLK